MLNQNDLIDLMAKAIADVETEDGMGLISEQITGWEIEQAAAAAYKAQLVALEPAAWMHIDQNNITRLAHTWARYMGETSKPLFLLP